MSKRKLHETELRAPQHAQFFHSRQTRAENSHEFQLRRIVIRPDGRLHVERIPREISTGRHFNKRGVQITVARSGGLSFGQRRNRKCRADRRRRGGDRVRLESRWLDARAVFRGSAIRGAAIAVFVEMHKLVADRGPHLLLKGSAARARMAGLVERSRRPARW